MVLDCSIEDVYLMNLFICFHAYWINEYNSIISSKTFLHFKTRSCIATFSSLSKQFGSFLDTIWNCCSTKICILNMKFISIDEMCEKECFFFDSVKSKHFGSVTISFKLKCSAVFCISALDRYIYVTVLTIDRCEGQYHDIYINTKILLIGKFSPVHLYLIMPSVRYV